MDDKIAINIEVDMDVEKALRKINAMKSSITKFVKQITDLNTKFKETGLIFDSAGSQLSDDKIKEVNKSLKKLAGSYRYIKGRVEGLRKEYKELNTLMKQAGENNKNIDVDELAERYSKLSKELDKYSRKMEKNKRKLLEIRKEYQFVGKEDLSKIDEKKLMKIKANAGMLGTLEGTNKELKTVYDTLKSTKATRMDKNLQLFTASIFEGIMGAFDEHLSRAMGGVSGKYNEVTMGRRLAGMAIKPEQFYMMLLRTVFKDDVDAFKAYMKSKGATKIEPSIDKRTGALKGIAVDVDPLSVIRELAMKGSISIPSGGEEPAKEISLSSRLRAGLAQGLVTNLGVQFSSFTAKIGIIGVILKKIYEVMEKLVKYSGVMSASLRILTLITQLSVKPVADVIGSILLPILMLVLKALMPILKNWNKIFGSWMKFSKEHPKTATTVQLTTTLVGLSQGGLFGGFAGAILPMFATSLVKGENKLLTGVAIPYLLDKMLGTGVFKFGDILGDSTKLSLKLFSTSILKTTKSLAEFGKATVLSRVALSTSALKLSSSFSSLVLGIGGVLGAFSLLGYSMIKGAESLASKWEKEGTYEKHMKAFESLGDLGAPITTLGDEGTTTETPDSNVYKNKKYWDAVSKRWNAMAEQYDVSSTIGNLKELSSNVSTSDFDDIIKNVTKAEQNWDKFSNVVKDTSNNTVKTGSKIPTTVSDMFNSIISPIKISSDYWQKNGDTIVDTATGLYNSTVSFLDKAKSVMDRGINKLATNLPVTGGGGGGARHIKMYQTGGWVDETGLAIVHQGEYVVPREDAFSIVEMLRSLGKTSYARQQKVEIHNHLSVNVNVDSVSSDIDIDDMANRISEILFERINMHTGTY